MIAFPPGSVFGERHIHIGAHTLIGPHVSLSVGDGGPVKPIEHDVVIRIGERCNIGRGSHIVGHESIEIGDDVTTGPYVYITDQNHVYADVNVPIADQWPEESPVVIGKGCWLGVGVIVLRARASATTSRVAGGSIVRGTLPDRCVAAGAPAKVVREYKDGAWHPPLREMSINPPEGWTQSGDSPRSAGSSDGSLG